MPDRWSNIIPGVSVKVFLDEFNIYIIGLVEQIAYHSVGPHPISRRPE